jgi:thiol-disulfide isomerase/thioredoxin
LSGNDEGKLVLEIKAIRLGINAHRDSLMKVINQAPPDQRGALQMQLEQSFNAFVGTKLEQTRGIIRSNLNTLAAITGAELLDPDQDFVIYSELAEALKRSYPNSGYAQSFVAKVEQMRATAIGSPAPEINLPSPDGTPIPLSSLRGKVVLIDFWASWCGPCRMENPNVVRLYNEKKNQGFEVYSVSLDKDKTAWMKAIEKDGLIWPSHVSDLAYWSSVVVKQYGFQGIPFTVLVGRDGKILAKGLRGQQLEEAVTRYLSE